MADKDDRKSQRGGDMSTRDGVSLSAHERHLLADLEARAAGDDPALASRLRSRRWSAILGRLGGRRRPQVGLPGAIALVVSGLALTVLAVAAGVWLAVFGIAATTAGGYVIGDRLSGRAQVPVGEPSEG